MKLTKQSFFDYMLLILFQFTFRCNPVSSESITIIPTMVCKQPSSVPTYFRPLDDANAVIELNKTVFNISRSGENRCVCAKNTTLAANYKCRKKTAIFPYIF